MSIKLEMPSIEDTTIQNIDNKYIELTQGVGNDKAVIQIPTMYQDIFFNLFKASMIDGE